MGGAVDVGGEPELATGGVKVGLALGEVAGLVVEDDGNVGLD